MLESKGHEAFHVGVCYVFPVKCTTWHMGHFNICIVRLTDKLCYEVVL